MTLIIQPSNSGSQRRKILFALQDNGSMTGAELNKICFRYGARIHELRKLGHTIKAKQIKRGLWEYTYEGFKAK